MGTPDKKRLKDLRSKFLQMTSPQEFGQERKENVTIISRNVPPMLARADASFLVLTDLLRAIPPEKCSEPDYNQFRTVAEEAYTMAKDADLLTKADNIQADFSDLTGSLAFLCRHLKVLQAAAEAKNSSCDLRVGICAGLPPGPESQCCFYGKITEQTLQNLQRALEKLCPAFQEKRRQFLESLTKSDMERFTRAHEEFLTHCKKRMDGSAS